jgi:DNA-binding GntR family transcriptional regulator
MQGTFAEHRAICQSIAERCTEPAADVMKAHLGFVLRELEEFVARHSGFEG